MIIRIFESCASMLFKRAGEFVAQLWHSHTLLAPFIFIKTLLYRHGNKRCSRRRYHRFFEDIILDALCKDASIIDVRYEPRVTRFLLPFLSLSFFVHHSVSDIKFFITYNKTFSIDYLCNSMIVPIRKRLSIPGSEYYSILLQFYYASFFFLLFNSLKSKSKYSKLVDAESTIGMNRFRVRIIQLRYE